MKKNTGVVAVLSEQHTGFSSDLNDGIWSLWVDTVTGGGSWERSKCILHVEGACIIGGQRVDCHK